MKQKDMLTSHELGFYKTFAYQSDKPKLKKKKDTEKDIVAARDYLYLYLLKQSKWGEVSITQKDLAEKLGVTVQTIRRGQQRLEKAGLLKKVKDADPALKLPTTFKVVKIKED